MPLVHHSFSPLSVQNFPSSLIVALVRRFAGSEPASISVSAKAEMAPLASRGKKRFFCSSVPNSLSGCGSPMDWLADSSAVSEPSLLVTIAIARV